MGHKWIDGFLQGPSTAFVMSSKCWGGAEGLGAVGFKKGGYLTNWSLQITVHGLPAGQALSTGDESAVCLTGTLM